MLTSLYEAKVNRAIEKAEQQDIEYEPLPWCHQRIFDSYQQLAELGDNYHFMFEQSNLAHTIGVYVKVDRQTNEVNVYLHETEGAEEPASKRIRKQMLDMMENLYPDMQINLFYPKEALQRDYASCGVFTLKAMNYFRKHPQAMDDWMAAMKSQIHDAAGCAIPLSMMKPELLKMFHGRLRPRSPHEPAITPAQLDQPVRKDGTKLYDYLFKYEREVVKTDGKTPTVVNTGPLVKRYEMMEEYQQISDQQERAKPGVPCTLTVETILSEPAPTKRKRTRTRRTRDFTCPQHIVDSIDLHEVNTWLSAQGDEQFSRKEWQSIGRYERYGGATRALKAKHEESYLWLKKTLKKSNAITPRDFLLTQWLGVPETKAKRKAK